VMTRREASRTTWPRRAFAAVGYRSRVVFAPKERLYIHSPEPEI